jgi:RNA polymerase sigma-70 factor (ECF subfamily)
MDESAFEAFYERTKQSLRLYVVKMMRDDALADDIFQDAYMRFLQSSVEHKDELQMKSYLYRIATNLMHDHWRKTKREQTWIGSEAELKQAGGKGNTIELRLDLNEAFHRLSYQQRSLLWLAYAEDYEHKEIAKMLRLRDKSVRVLLFRAKQKLIEVCRHMGITLENIS